MTFAQTQGITIHYRGCQNAQPGSPLWYLRKVAGPAVTIVDSAETTALELASQLRAAHLECDGGSTRRISLLATDGPERFARVGSQFLGESFTPADVEIVDLGVIGSASA